MAKTIVNPPIRTTKVSNSAGFSKGSLGNDTVPGPAEGAPLINSKHVDDCSVKRVVYPDGNYPGSESVFNGQK